MIHCLLSYFILYCWIATHSILSRPYRVPRIPSRSILKPPHYNASIYFLPQYYLSTPIIFQSVLSSCNTFRFNTSQLDSSSPAMLQSKVFMLRSIQFLSVQYDSLPPITFHNVLSSWNPFHFKTSQLYSLFSIIFNTIPYHCDQLHPFLY